MIPPLLLLLLGLGVAGAAAAIGVAAAAVSQIELTRWVSYKLRGAAAAVRLLENPGMVLATANALTTLGIILAAGAVPALLARTTGTFLGVVTVAVIVPLFVSAAYLVPRVVGRRWAEAIVSRAVPGIEWAGRLLAPFIPRREPSTRTALAAVLSHAGTDALAASDEIEVVSGVLAFADRPVRELMTPRTAIVAIPEGMAAAEAAHVFSQAGFSRYPVYHGSLDAIVGVAHAFDLLQLQPEDPVPVRPVLRVPGTQHAAELMLAMQRGQGRLAAVRDEYGGTAGLVTFEDLLRALVREVFEEDEPVPEGGPPPRLVVLEGSAPAAELEEAFGVKVDSRGAQTVGGLLIQALGRIPRPGGRFLYMGLEFDVLAASATRVERVAVRPGGVRAISLDRPEEPS
ncbi:MAG TPA: hemolysin family protein [Gemmatimonadales bacterium]|nr:hemolysin family protein [Gemmatimonadales bacterium]